MTNPSLCHGRRIFPFGYECHWLHCPVLWDDELCIFRLEDDDPNPDDDPRCRPQADHAA
jgi:hypothetical protein